MRAPSHDQDLAPSVKNHAGLGEGFDRWLQERKEVKSERHRVRADVAFSIQQTIACFMTDFIDPFVSKWIQDRFGKKASTLEQNVKGEIVGDLGGAVVYVAARSIFRRPLDGLAHVVQRLADPALEKMGKAHLSVWAHRHHIDPQSPEYQQTLEHFKRYQAGSWVDSATMSSMTAGVNVLAQKYMFKNPEHMGLIIGSKLVGVGLTMGTVLGARMILPDASRALDQEITEKYVSPVARSVERHLLDSEEDQQNRRKWHQFKTKQQRELREKEKGSWKESVQTAEPSSETAIRGN